MKYIESLKIQAPKMNGGVPLASSFAFTFNGTFLSLLNTILSHNFSQWSKVLLTL